MILADKIINERKKNDWSQEELAEKLSVSRQSVSKWEGAQSVPDLNRIIQMANLFNVSTDYLLKDEIEEKLQEDLNESESGRNVRKVSVEEVLSYLKVIQKTTKLKALAGLVVVLSPTVLLFLLGLHEANIFTVPSNIVCCIGIVAILMHISVLVCLMIVIHTSEKDYMYLKKDEFETEYGAIGIVKEKIKEFETFRIILSIVSVFCFAFSPLGLIVAAFAGGGNSIIIWMVCLLLILIAVGTYILIYVKSTTKGFYVLFDVKK